MDTVLGETLRILLCTDAASEGFDLPSCSVLINYDMPWNPMRVEQRIGRIDRIGQRATIIQIRNYYDQDSVDQLVYQALRERLDLFVSSIGPLQAVLGDVDGGLWPKGMRRTDGVAWLRP
jgi:superfamily II DNA/RNA helicase